ncbi:pali-domain-containing protein [Rhizopogon vinicolor AM-OR11-026]|uniref:Pali-domain-containing protein n=1 Tax=Rhizopogon vinicolor AM-OR11-026 TaxID=1314800 RepID=A0A1B7NGY5_9AGAM|nr:pali-domain-containing protein [Rhizopogon vinicolor AM-OR11-026]
MAASPALPGLFFCFAAMVLLIFVSVSTPTWNKVSFLNVNQLSFGVFGYTGSKVQIGYYFPLPGDINTTTLHNLTSVLILYPIAAGLSGLALLFGSCGAAYHRAGTVFMSLLAALAMLCTLVAWVVSMSLFGIVKSRLSSDHIDASWGNANWLALGALVALLIGFCTAACGVFGHYKRSRVR